MSEGRLPAPGEAAPDFTLPSTSGESVTFSAAWAESPVLLLFFPLAFTGTCTAQMCELTADLDAYRSRGVRVLPLSVDSVETLRVYREQEGLEVELLSDFHRTVCRAYGTFNPERFYANRAYVLIDRDGIVRWSYQEEHNGLRRGTAEVLAQLESVG